MDHRLKSRDLRSRAIRYSLLESWYGEERAQVEIAAHTDPGENLADAVDRLVSDFGNEEIISYIRLVQDWPLYCGEALAQYLTPNGIKDGILTLTVPHSGLLSMINPSIELIHSKIRQTFGEDFCREIRLIAGAGSRRKKRPQPEQ